MHVQGRGLRSRERGAGREAGAKEGMHGKIING